MIITILAIIFLVGILVLTIAGGKILQKKAGDGTNADREKCSLCKSMYDKHDLVIRQVGDYKLLHFCRSCIVKLYADMGMKN